jgi:hypothetical protein
MDFKSLILVLINYLKLDVYFNEKEQNLIIVKNSTNETSFCSETINTYYNLYKQDLQIVLNIGFSIGDNQSNRTIEEFFGHWDFKYIEFQYSIEKSDLIYKREEILDEFKNEITNLNYSFIDLKPMRIYYFSYGLVKLVNKTKFIYPFFIGDKRIKVKTCFGQPSQPFKLIHGFADQDYLIYWQKPLIVNAPFVCYYEIILIKNKGVMNVMNTTKLFFNIKKSDLVKVKTIEIYAVNSINCYGPKTNCNFDLIRSDKEVIEINQSNLLINNQGPLITRPIIDIIHSKNKARKLSLNFFYILGQYLLLFYHKL